MAEEVEKIHIGGVTISKGRTEGKLWIENREGEGMGCDVEFLEKYLEEWFNEHF